MLAHVGTLYLNTGQEQEPQGSAHPFITPWQAFRCADDHYIVVAPREEHFWRRLCLALGMPELGERAEFADAAARQANRDILLPMLEGIFAEKGSRQWLTVLRAAGVPASPVNTLASVFDDPHVAARKMATSYPTDQGEIRTIGNAVKVQDAEERVLQRAPALGEHTLEVARSVLGYDEEHISQLVGEGAFGPGASGRGPRAEEVSP
jgi:crotonobetainyl-CoA:carnitine CoA-transferase CaiB-like acyl-CoA transferase